MSTIKIGWLKDENGKIFAPRTNTSQITDGNGNNLQIILDDIHESVENRLPLEGGKLSGDLSVEKNGTAESKSGVKNALHEVNMYASEFGNAGLYDATQSKWLVMSSADGVVDYAAGTMNGAKILTANDFIITGTPEEATLTINLDAVAPSIELPIAEEASF